MTLRHLVMGAAAAVLLTAPAEAADQPKRGGILSFAVEAEPPDYDCHKATSFAFIHPVRPSYSTLLKFDAPNYPKIKGDLAQSWSASPDNLTFTFKLRAGVKFHDGSAFSSADVRASYDRIIHPPPGVVSARRASYEDIGSIDTPDAQTVVFHMKAPNAAMPAQFASPWDCIYSAAKLAQDPKFPEKNVLGTGPFKFKEYVKGGYWEGTRFEDYFEKGKPYLDGYKAIFIKGAAAINAIQGGQIAAEFRGQSPSDRDQLVQALGAKIKVEESPWICNLVVAFNTSKKPFDDARVRRALSIAVDRWGGSVPLSKIAIVGPVGGVLRPGYSLAVGTSELEKMPGFSKDIKTSREEAQKLLKQAGAGSLKFKLTNRNVPMPYTPVGVYLIDQWRRIGIQVEHDQLETSAYLAALSSGNYDAGLDFNCDYMDEPNLQLIKYLSADKSSVNYGRYNDRTLDDLYEKQKRATDPAQRAKLLREFETRALTEAYTVPTIWWHRIIAHSAALKGWNITPSHYLNQDLTEVWLDQ
jgi:peptide/nickel transport system substrate-binding protein